MRSALLKPIVRSLIAILCLGMSLTGMDCSKLLDSNTDDIAEIVGSWQLVSESGAQFDVCSGETVTYSANHIAQLQCPSQSAITRTVAVTNGTISYQETSIQYNYTVTTSTNPPQLLMEGVNVSRNLVYNKVIAATPPPPPVSNNKDTKLNNSSDKLR
ncbi:hypothetical protein BH10BAC5_BH10BAC5_13160 [soil metagenome]